MHCSLPVIKRPFSLDMFYIIMYIIIYSYCIFIDFLSPSIRNTFAHVRRGLVETNNSFLLTNYVYAKKKNRPKVGTCLNVNVISWMLLGYKMWQNAVRNCSVKETDLCRIFLFCLETQEGINNKRNMTDTVFLWSFITV